MATSPGGHLNPQGLTPGIGPSFDPSKPSANKKYATSQIDAARTKFQKAQSEKKWKAQQAAKYDAQKATATPAHIPGTPNKLQVLQSQWSAQNAAPAKKPGLFSRMHRAVAQNVRQFGRRK